MGFSKKNILPTIRIPLRFHHQFEDSETGETYASSVDVVHIFAMPTTHQRSRYQRENVKVKGKKMIYSGPEASWNLFQGCIRAVEGYEDDLPREGQTRTSIIEYFNDEIIRHHAEGAADELMRILESEDMQLEKKSGPSSGA